MDGTIHLNFTGQNPVHTPSGNRPGMLKIFNQDAGAAPTSIAYQTQIPMVHTQICQDNKFQSRIEGTSQPWNGVNLYAENRHPPVVPWKPQSDESGLQTETGKK